MNEIAARHEIPNGPAQLTAAATAGTAHTVPTASTGTKWRQWWTDQAAACAQGGPVEQLGAQQGFVVTQQQARRCGADAATIRRHVRRGTWSIPRRGALSVVTVPDPEPDDYTARRLAQRRRMTLAATAAALTHPGQVISGRSAATLCGLPTFREPETAQLTASPPTTLGNRSALLVRSATLGAAEVTTWFGAPVTEPARTLVDLGRHDRGDGVIAADAALHEGLIGPEDIETALARARGWPGVRRAREVLRLADERAESPLESLVRLALHDSRMPLPQPQQWIYDPWRHKWYRVDLVWPEQRVIIEADGRLKYAGPDALWEEKLREEALSRLGYRVVRVLWSDVVYDWPATLSRIRRALRHATAA